MEQIQASLVESAYTYASYREMIDQLLVAGKTTGDDQSEAMLEYTRLNVKRMQRLDKTIRLEAETTRFLSEGGLPCTWLVLTEAWCGDAAQVIPVLEKMANESPGARLRLLLRDENLDVMDAFLTNGSRSIPKLILLDEHHRVRASWGPRPEAAQQLLLEGKKALAALADPEEKKARANELSAALHSWYAKDKGRSTQSEVLQALGSYKRIQVPS